MRWTVHGERVVYDSPWVRVALADVEAAGLRVPEHHVVRVPSQVAAAVVTDPRRGVLMLWRHRFITDAWGWEVPAGRIDAGEQPADAAAREALEETGWEVDDVRPLVAYHPSNGLTDQLFHLFTARAVRRVGDPVDAYEAERVEWLDADRVRELLDGGLVDGLSLTALLVADRRGLLP